MLSPALAVVLALLIAYMLAAGVFWLCQSRLVYRPLERVPESTPESTRESVREPLRQRGRRAGDGDDGLGGAEIHLRTADGLRLHGRYFGHPAPAATVLFCHGNSSTVHHCLDIAAMYRRLGHAVLLFDYRGYGRSAGRPTEEGTYLDVVAAWEYLRHEHGLAPCDIVVAGRSLGAAIAARLAAQHTPRALVLESAFTSMPEVAARRYPWLPVRRLMRYRYPVLEYIPRLRCPLLIVHSREDEMVPFAHAQRLYALAPGPKQLLEIDGPHRDLRRTTNARYEGGIAAFLAGCRG